MVASYFGSTKEGDQERLLRRNNFLAKIGEMFLAGGTYAEAWRRKGQIR